MLFKKYKLITDMCNDDKYLYKRFFTKDNFENATSHSIQVLPIEYKDCTYEEYEVLIMKKLDTYKRLIEKDYKKFIDEYINKCTELTINELLLLKENIETELINDYLIYPKGYKRKVPGVKYWYQEEITNLKKEKGKKAIKTDIEDQGWQIRFEEIIDDAFIQVQGINIKDGEYFVNNIIPNFSRQVNDQHQIKIPINFSLPLAEILEYVTKVKNGINPKTPLELLGKKLEKADDLSNLNLIDKKGKKISLDNTRGETPQKKLADLFYVYDMKAKGFTDIDIVYELDEFYTAKKTNMSENTIKKYFSIAQDYIENEKYKELITGKEHSVIGTDTVSHIVSKSPIKSTDSC